MLILNLFSIKAILAIACNFMKFSTDTSTFSFYSLPLWHFHSLINSLQNTKILNVGCKIFGFDSTHGSID